MKNIYFLSVILVSFFFWFPACKQNDHKSMKDNETHAEKTEKTEDLISNKSYNISKIADETDCLALGGQWFDETKTCNFTEDIVDFFSDTKCYYLKSDEETHFLVLAYQGPEQGVRGTYEVVNAAKENVTGSFRSYSEQKIDNGTFIAKGFYENLSEEDFFIKEKFIIFTADEARIGLGKRELSKDKTTHLYRNQTKLDFYTLAIPLDSGCNNRPMPRN